MPQRATGFQEFPPLDLCIPEMQKKKQRPFFSKFNAKPKKETPEGFSLPAQL